MRRNELGKDVKVQAALRGWEVLVRRDGRWHPVAHRANLGSAYTVARRWV